jgi:hypothetical protein
MTYVFITVVCNVFEFISRSLDFCVSTERSAGAYSCIRYVLGGGGDGGGGGVAG